MVICGDVKQSDATPLSHARVTLQAFETTTGQLVPVAEILTQPDGGFRFEIPTTPGLHSPEIDTDNLLATVHHRNRQLPLISASMLPLYRSDKYIELVVETLPFSRASGVATAPTRVSLVQDPGIISPMIRSSEAWEHYNRLETFSLNFLVLKKNFDDLNTLLAVTSSPAGIEALFFRGSEDRVGFFLDELTRRLHNFLASCTTFEDASENLLDDWLKGTPHRDNYFGELRSRLKTHPVAQFVRQLRHFALHERLPLASAQYGQEARPGGKEDINATLSLSTADLLRWSGWKPASRRFLADHSPDIDIASFCSEYCDLARAFHFWLHDELKAVFKDELAWLEAMTARVRAALGKNEVSGSA